MKSEDSLPGRSDYGSAKGVHRQSRELKVGSTAGGVAIVGTEFQCGKTVLMAGLAGLLLLEGFTARAVKPVLTGRRADWEAEQAFINAVARSRPEAPGAILPHEGALSIAQWQQAVGLGAPGSQFTLIELPGAYGTPILFASGDSLGGGKAWLDSTDLLAELNVPCILVSKHNFAALEEFNVGAAYLKSRKANVIGLVTVETTYDAGKELETRLPRSEVELSLRSMTGVPFLGCIKHSQSISVPRVHQGNVIKLTTGGIDLLSILKTLNLEVPT
jgi:dethiobiotin synthetase